MKFKPHEYQQRAMQMMLDNPCVGCFMDMGLGKTVTTLTVIRKLRLDMLSIGKTLIIAPLKVSECTWQQEIEKWDDISDLTYSTVLGTQQERLAALKKDADIYIINRDNVQWLVDTLKNKWFFDVVVLDESSSFKNPKAKRFRALKTVRSRIRRVIALTGTPAARDYMDLWSQVFLLDGGQRLGRTLTQYRDTFFLPDKRNGTIIYSYRLRNGAAEAIQKALSDICFSMKAEDYLQLPDLIVNDIPVQLDKKAMGDYRKLEKEYVLSLPDDTVIDAGSAAVLRNKLLQIASGSVYDETGAPNFIHNCKLDALTELIDAINSPILLFYSFRHSLPFLKEELKNKGIKYREYEGPKDAEDWNNGKIDVLIAHPASCAYGLNLQKGGHNIVWYGLTDSLELYLQANARLHRQGQTHPVVVHRLICTDTADEDVRYGLEAKDRMQEALLQRMKLRVEQIRKER